MRRRIGAHSSVVVPPSAGVTNEQDLEQTKGGGTMDDDMNTPRRARRSAPDPDDPRLGAGSGAGTRPNSPSDGSAHPGVEREPLGENTGFLHAPNYGHSTDSAKNVGSGARAAAPARGPRRAKRAAPSDGLASNSAGAHDGELFDIEQVGLHSPGETADRASRRAPANPWATASPYDSVGTSTTDRSASGGQASGHRAARAGTGTKRFSMRDPEGRSAAKPDAGSTGAAGEARSTADGPTTAPSGKTAHAAGNEGSHGFGWTMLRTTLGSLVPGAGLMGTRLTMIGTLLFMMTVVFGAGAILAAVIHPPIVLAALANSKGLMVLGFMLAAITVIWMAIVTGTYLVTRPRRMKRWQRIVGAIVVFLMTSLVGSVSSVASAYAFESASVLQNIFGNTGRSQTRPLGDWATQDRVNILLLGGDSGESRDEGLGIRTDTVMVASINTHTGDTVLIQLPRNLENVPFPEGSELAEVYPDGRVWEGSGEPEDNYMLNAVWNEVPTEHPELFADSDQPGADATKLAVSGITGLTVDYYAMINIDGIQALVDAMGGVTVNVNFPIAKGGHVDGYGSEECGVDGNLSVGANQTLGGADAMWYARSRCNDPDYDYGRMRRQSCLVNAIIKQANPQTLLTRYEAIAAAGKGLMSTDIPENMLDDVTNLALQVKDASITRTVFSQAISGDPQEGDVDPGNPDYAAIRARIAAAITASDNPTAASSSAAPTSSAAAGATSAVPATTAAQAATSSATAGSSSSAESMVDACEYHPS